MLQSTKLKGVGDLKSFLTTVMEIKFSLLASGLALVVFPHYASFPMFWNGNIYPVPLYVGSM